MSVRKETIEDFKYDFTPNVDGSFGMKEKLGTKELTGKRAKKRYVKLMATVEVNGAEFNADAESISYMTSVLAIANAKFNQGVVAGMPTNDLNTAIYGQTIPWKDKVGVTRQISIGELPDALELAMHKLAEIVQAY